MKPPLPDQVIYELDGVDQTNVHLRADIHEGRDVWRKLGGMEMGSVWGHGSYLAPDWTADVLHREAQFLADRGGALDQLSEPDQAKRIAEVSLEMRTNTYDEATGV